MWLIYNNVINEYNKFVIEGIKEHDTVDNGDSEITIEKNCYFE